MGHWGMRDTEEYGAIQQTELTLFIMVQSTIILIEENSKIIAEAHSCSMFLIFWVYNFENKKQKHI